MTHAAGPIALILGVAFVLAPSGLTAQDTTRAGGTQPSCTLRWESLTDSTASRSIKTDPDRYRHHVWNGMRWFCGGAVMTADSAVQYPGDRVVMVGSVHYRDSIRTLDARRLTYYQASDHIEARDSVDLVRRSTGSTLEAPSVDLYRAGGGRIRQTVATGGTRMTIYPPDDTAGGKSKPYRVTSREATIFGDDRTIARGNVVITREDFRGTGQRARFSPEGDGQITGDPVLTGQDYRLTGDTVRTIGSQGTLEQVRAIGSGHLVSQGMDVRAPRIRVRLVDGAVRNLWAYGGDARSRSASRVMLGDSIHMVFRGEQPDSITAVGEAAALEVDSSETLPWSREEDERPDSTGVAVDETAEGSSDSTSGGRSGTLFTMERDWLRGDTVRARFGSSSGDPPSPAGTDTTRVDDVTLQELRAIGDARAYYRITRDTARDRRGRNYLLGQQIVVEFREGDPERVLGFQAIGVYLEPAAPGAASAPGPLGPPTPGAGGGVAADTAADGGPTFPDTSAATDTTGGGPGP